MFGSSSPLQPNVEAPDTVFDDIPPHDFHELAETLSYAMTTYPGILPILLYFMVAYGVGEERSAEYDFLFTPLTVIYFLAMFYLGNGFRKMEEGLMRSPSEGEQELCPNVNLSARYLLYLSIPGRELLKRLIQYVLNSICCRANADAGERIPLASNRNLLLSQRSYQPSSPLPGSASERHNQL